MTDQEHDVTATFAFSTYGYKDQVEATIEKMRRELALVFGRDVKIKRRVIRGKHDRGEAANAASATT